MRRLSAPAVRFLAGLAAAAALAFPSAATLWLATPSADDIQQRVAAITQARGVVLLRPHEVPVQLSEAVVATEDERFYSHHGIDSVGLGRAILYDVVEVCLCQGGSTITEQLVKDVYLGGSDRGRNKLYDMVLALKAERVIGKPVIMADYLSIITTGFGHYGVTDAACAYFRAPLGQLTLGQYALLAGVTQAPSVYDPTVNHDAAAQRRSQVLAAMESHREITAEQEAAANAEPVLDRGPDRPGC